MCLTCACSMSDDELSDDDDASWKVRRSAAKCLVAIINNYFDLLTSLYPKVSPLVVSRFKEREENVKIDIFNVFIALLHQVGPASDQFLSVMLTFIGAFRSMSMKLQIILLLHAGGHSS